MRLKLEKSNNNELLIVKVIARNQLGEAYATTGLKLRKRRDDFRGILGKKESKYKRTSLAALCHLRFR